jgi:hypothetical protein
MYEKLRVHDEYQDITEKAGPALEANEWFRQWRLAFDRASRYRYPDPSNGFAKLEFLEAAGKYAPGWADRHIVGVRVPDPYGEPEKSLADLIDAFHIHLQYASSKGTRNEGNGLYECPCHSDLVSHKPEHCWYVKAAVSGKHPKRLNKKWINKTRDALQEPRWAWLLDTGKVGGAK